MRCILPSFNRGCLYFTLFTKVWGFFKNLRNDVYVIIDEDYLTRRHLFDFCKKDKGYTCGGFSHTSLHLVYFVKKIIIEIMEMTPAETAEEGGEKVQTSPPIQIVRVPVKHANLGIRSHAM